MKLSAYDKGGIMSAAKDVTRCLSKKETLLAQKEAVMARALEAQKKIDEQIAQVEQEIAYYSKPVVDKTGYQPLELVQKVGKGYQFIYPNVIPEEEKKDENETQVQETTKSNPIETQSEVKDLDAEEDKDWEELIDSGKMIPEEQPINEPEPENPDDFNPFK